MGKKKKKHHDSEASVEEQDSPVEEQGSLDEVSSEASQEQDEALCPECVSAVCQCEAPKEKPSLAKQVVEHVEVPSKYAKFQKGN